MKARLIFHEGGIQLLLTTGRIVTLTLGAAREFLLNYDRGDYYSGSGTWDYENLTMESYRGDTIAFVDDGGMLCIKDPVRYREIMVNEDTKYLTVAEYANLHGKQTAIIRRFCQNGRIVGAIQKGKTWLIPEDSPYPPDTRVRCNR